MSKSLTTRLAGQEDQIIKDTEYYGIQYAMDKYQVKDYISFRRWLNAQTHAPNFGLHPLYCAASGRSVAEDIVDALVSKLLSLEARNQSLTERVRYLELQLNEREKYNRGKAVSLLETLKGGV